MRGRDLPPRDPGGLHPGGSALGGCMHAPDSMHPTGMLSCLICYLFLIIVMFSDGLIMCHICVFSMFITINTKMSTLPICYLHCYFPLCCTDGPPAF